MQLKVINCIATKAQFLLVKFFSWTHRNTKAETSSYHMHDIEEQLGQRGFLLWLATGDTRNGDCICVLLGSAAPFVFRREGNRWKLVGEWVIPGIIQGE